MPVTTPNMNLLEPVIGVDSGLVWEQSINANTGRIDFHDHSTNNGVQIQPAGLNISSDLPFNSNNATNLRSTRYTPQGSPLSGPLDLGCLYVSGVDLYYNDGAGNQVKITSGGMVNATSSGITDGTATASFVSSVLVVNEAVDTPANIQAGSILIGNNVANSKFITLEPPNALAANYTLTLPAAAPASTSFVTMDNSGNLAAAVSTSAGITRANLVPVGQVVSSSCGFFTTTSGTPVAVTNLSVNLTTTGRPVQVMIQPDGTSNQSGFGGTIVNNGFIVYRQIKRGSTVIATDYVELNTVNTNSNSYAPVSMCFLDVVAAGTYNYTVTLAAATSSTTAALFSAVLIAFEIK